MSNTKDPNRQSGENIKRKFFPITRRKIIGAGVVGLAAAATTRSAIANTQKPVKSESGINSEGETSAEGRFPAVGNLQCPLRQIQR